MLDETHDDKLGHKFKFLNHTFNRAFNNSLSKSGITGSQSFILAYLDNCKENPCQHDIEKRFNIKHPTATGILKRLEEKNCVVFIPDEDDKRLKRIAITDYGRQVSNSTKDSLDNVEAHMASMLNEDEFKTLNYLLDKLVVQMREEGKNHRKDEH